MRIRRIMYSISYFADNNSTTLSDIVWVGYSRRFFFLFIPHTYVHIDIRFGKFSFSFSCNSIWLFVLQILFHYFRDSHRDVVTRHAHCMAFSTFVTILANRRTFSLIYVQVVIFSCVSIWKNTSSIDIRRITKRKMFISSDFFLIYMRGMWNKIIGFRLHSMLCRLFLPLLTQNTLNTLYIRLFKHSISASSLSLSSSLFSLSFPAPFFLLFVLKHFLHIIGYVGSGICWFMRFTKCVMGRAPTVKRLQRDFLPPSLEFLFRIPSPRPRFNLQKSESSLINRKIVKWINVRPRKM